jgi:hypothetical protein
MFVKLLCVAAVLTFVNAGQDEGRFKAMPRWYGDMLRSGAIELPKTTPRASPFQACSSQRLKGCQVKFNKQLGIADDLDFNNPNVLDYAIDRIFATGPNGLADVCNARQTFQGCLGAQYFACLDPVFYVKQGFNEQFAYEFLSIFLSLEFQCVSGFTVGSRNWQCIVNTPIREQTTLNTCYNAYQKSVQDGANVCTSTTTLTKCLAFFFRSNCPAGAPKSEAGWWVCQDTIQTFLAQGCNIQCPITN